MRIRKSDHKDERTSKRPKKATIAAKMCLTQQILNQALEPYLPTDLHPLVRAYYGSSWEYEVTKRNNHQVDQKLKRHLSIDSIAYSPSGKQIACGSPSSFAPAIFDCATQRSTSFCNADNNVNICQLKWLPMRNQILSASATTLKIWQPHQKKPLYTITANRSNPSAYSNNYVIDHSPSEQLIAISYAACIDIMKNEATNTVINTLSTDDLRAIPFASTVTYHPCKEDSIAIGCGNKILLWDITRDKPIKTISTATNTMVDQISYTPNGSLLACAYLYTVQLWSTQDNELIHSFDKASALIKPLAYSPDSHLIAVASSDNKVKILCTRMRKALHLLESENNIQSLAFSPDGLTPRWRRI
jgi:WD40 repeat protein